MRDTFPALALLALAACATTAAAPPSREAASFRFGQTARVGPLRVTPLALVEDSRCPQGVACVWAGQVRITARVIAPGRNGVRELKSGEPVAIGSGMLVLEQVAPPAPRAGSKLPRAAYRFALRYTPNIMRER